MKKIYSVKLQKVCCFLSVMLLVLGARFSAVGQHNVYAVVPSGDDARLKVNFVQANGNTTSMYVKKADISNGQLNTILYNPLSGTFGSDVFFRGWTTDPNYDATDIANAMTMADVRSAVTDTLNAYNSSRPLTDGHEVTFYAMLFKAYNVTYFNGKNTFPGYNGAVLGVDQILYRADATSPYMSYTVNMGFSTDTSTAFFMGWHVVDGASNVQAHSDGRIYPNDTVIQLNGNVSFSVDVAQGHWLVFDENGKGATYNAPRFLFPEAITTEPEEPTRFGYEFRGWYTDAACSAGNKFEFGYTLIENTTIYAKWDPKSTANYTVLIWKQNITGTGYDFVESVTIEDAAVGSTPDAVNATTGAVTGTDYAGETGFTFASTDQASQTVATEGNTVVNVYYDRNTITLNFYIPEIVTTYDYVETQNSGIWRWYDVYIYQNGQYQQVHYYLGALGWYSQWSSIFNNTRYYGTVYDQVTVTNYVWSQYQTMSGLYGTTLAENSYTWPTAYDWYDGHDDNGGTSGTRTTFYDAFMIPSGASVENFYGRTAQTGNSFVEFYKQNEEETGYDLANSFSTNSNNPTFSISDKYSGFSANHYVVNGNTTQLGEKDANGYYATGVGYANTTLQIYYNRNAYSIFFIDGVYVDGNNNTTDETNKGKIKEVKDVVYGSNIASYNSSGEDYYEPTNNNGYVFEGWYVDDACTTPYSFTTMPEGDLTIFAKWRLREYRVFLNPNAGTDPTLNWGSDEQSMTFRVSYNGKVSVPTGLRNGYKFVGWYRDAAFTQLFNTDAYPMNETNVTTPYDQTTMMTDSMTRWGTIVTPPAPYTAPFNSDYERGRFWITKRFDLYAKWSAELEGAEGISLVYDASGGFNAPVDNKLYTDMAHAIAAGGCTPPSGKVFSHWEVQQCSGGTSYVSSGATALAGGQFIVKKDDACRTEREGSTAADPLYDYTVRLKAVYVDAELPSQTSIVWLLNDGSGDTVRTDGLGTGTYPTLAINEAVVIPTAPTRTGYIFKGWYRLSVSAGSEPQDVVLQCNPNFLYYNNSIYYKDEACGEADTASHVFADNVSPYYYLYAIWEPEVEIDFPRIFCLNETEGITLPTAASTNNDVTLTWTYNSSPVTVVNTTAEVTNAVYTYTTSDGCVTDTIQVTVRDGATLEIVDPGVLCSTLEGGTKTITATITGAPVDYDIAWLYRGSNSAVQHYAASTTSVTFDANVVPDDDACVGTYPLVLAYSDGVCVKYDTIDIVIGVNDSWKSEFADSSKTVECVSEVVAPTLPEITDNCGNAITFTATTIPSAADIAAAACGGEVSYVYEASDCTDSASHKKEWRFTYTVTPPTLTFNGTITDVTDENACYSAGYAQSKLLTANDVKGMYTSNCEREISVDISDNAPATNTNCLWTYTRTFTISDGCGNTDTKTQSVSGSDQTAPALTGTWPDNIEGQDNCFANAETSGLYTDAQVKALYEDCSEIMVEHTDANTLTEDCGWTITRTYTIKDACNNPVTPAPTMSVSGSDQTAPALTGTWPNNITS